MVFLVIKLIVYEEKRYWMWFNLVSKTPNYQGVCIRGEQKSIRTSKTDPNDWPIRFSYSFAGFDQFYFNKTKDCRFGDRFVKKKLKTSRIDRK